MQCLINIRELYEELPIKWKQILEPHKEDLQLVQNEIDLNYIKYGERLHIYPDQNDIFRIFKEVFVEDIKIIILGQDCYHRSGQAIGRSFGVPHNIIIPPSLKNIAKELYNDVGVILSDYTLGKWSEQGVLLLNCAMTVREGEPGSHLDVWENFTNGAIKKISENCNNIVFMLWGKYAQKKQCIISSEKDHLILKSNHPSPLSANRGGWFGCKHFSKANEYLSKNNKAEIKW